ncbi:hypothetical protein [Streptomyces tremellae]|uniref:Tail assembly chaperone n=1 Tax=Streptomyces tremellae TaxID=1124239 RepID=A0ABP7EKH8_9ACTN
MGYRRKRKVIEVKLTGEHQGFEARLRGKTLGEFLELNGIGEIDRSALDNQLREMADSLISWNLEDETGAPVPATAKAVYAEDQELMLALAAEWMRLLHGGMTRPLEQPSTDGAPSLEASLPMEPVSESLAS